MKARGGKAGYTVFIDTQTAVGQFVSNPRKQSYVNEEIAGVEHYIIALLWVFWRERGKTQLQCYVDSNTGNGGLTFNTALQLLCKAGAYQLMHNMCCHKER